MALLSSLLSAIGNVFGLLTGRSALRNSPAMQAAASAKTDAAIAAGSAQAVAQAKTGTAAALANLRKLTAE